MNECTRAYTKRGLGFEAVCLFHGVLVSSWKGGLFSWWGIYLLVCPNCWVGFGILHRPNVVVFRAVGVGFAHG